MRFDQSDLTRDKFLGGALEILQPRTGHRAGVDPVLLAAAIDAKPGDQLLELGCGSGVASLCLARRVSGVRSVAVELQKSYADLARQNAAANGIDLRVYQADIQVMPSEILNVSFDHVFANPPYYERTSGTLAADAGKAIALAGDTPLSVWIDVATRRAKPGGVVTLIQKAERLYDVLAAIDGRLGDVKVCPIASRAGRRAKLVLVQGRKASRGIFQLLAPVVLHVGAVHERDGDSYTDHIRSVLRDGAALNVL